MLFSAITSVHRVCRTLVDRVVPARQICTSGNLRLWVTTPLCAEPLKKKKRLDPAIIKQREERRRKRLEKQIRRLEKNAKQLKPIEENEIPTEVIHEKAARARPSPKLSAEQLNLRASLTKEWSIFRYRQHLRDAQMIDRIMASQQWALDQLQAESEELYRAAVTHDPDLMPFNCTGPVETPPIPKYDSPDGEYIDTSKKWDVAPSDLLGKPRKRV